uniref:Testis specific 10 n=1 Tax=Oryctolagus cuniculus TaxID=9986 RepID=A0A5F9D1H2_RABIT
MSSAEDAGPRSPRRDPERQVTTKEHDFGLGAPVSEAEKYQKTLQLEQEVRNQDRFISTLKLQIEDLTQTNHGLEEYVRKLLDSKEVVSSQVDDLTSHNEHLCKELIKIDQLAQQLEKEKNFVVNIADKELEEAKIELICQQNNIIVLEDTIKKLRSIILETEKAQNKSPSRLDSFVKTLEADRDYYRSEAQNLRKMIRSRSKSPRRPSPSSRGANCDVELLKSTTRDREELKCMLEKYERHLAEIQGNVKVLTSERDKTFLLYEQAQEEIARLRREMMKSCKSPKSTTAHAILRRVETERDVAFTDLRRMTTERDSLRERLKIAQETAFNEKAHLEQRIEELECTVHNESENRQMMDQLRKANEDAESWENKSRQLEADNNTLKLELITAEAEGNRLKEKVDSLNREVEQHLNAERSYKSQISTLHKSVVKMEEELQKVQFEKVSALADLSSTRELCIKLDSSKELLNRQLVAKDQEIEMMENELDSARSEIELLRSQMTNERISMQNLEALLVANRDKEYQSQIALQEKESEIQLLKEHLCLAENKMAIQSRDVAQFRNVVTQLEADLDITKRQLGTERFERERAVQELRRQNYSSNAYHLSSTMKPNAKCHSPERVHHRSPDRGLDRSLEENLCYRDF